MSAAGTGPTVSVVIPAFNAARYVEAAIGSVLGQTYPSIELIVLDDGSTDGTAEILKRHGQGILWESNANVGQSATLNRGWAISRGSILSYLGADDLLMPEAVSAAVECLMQHPDVVLTYCDYQLMDPSSRPIRRVRAPEFDYMRMLTRLECAPGPGVFLRRSAYEQVGGWDTALRQMPDLDYWLRLGRVGALRRIPRVLASFRVHAQSMTFSVPDAQRAGEPVRVISQALARQPDSVESYALRNEALANAHLYSAQLHMRARRYRMAFEEIRRSVKARPLAVLRPSSVRRLANSLLNRPVHTLLWRLRDVLAP